LKLSANGEKGGEACDIDFFISDLQLEQMCSQWCFLVNAG
jgi:hypothetical protein